MHNGLHIRILVTKIKITAMEEDNRAERIEVAFQQLRAEKFAQNLPFLILSGKLPEGQAYCEYDNHIEIRLTKVEGDNYASTLVRELNPVEAFKVRTIDYAKPTLIIISGLQAKGNLHLVNSCFLMNSKE